jgi:hypothetical protein
VCASITSCVHLKACRFCQDKSVIVMVRFKNRWIAVELVLEDKKGGSNEVVSNSAFLEVSICLIAVTVTNT